MAKTSRTSSLSRLYLKCLGYIFAIAFLSFYVQYPALSSRSGIEPSERTFAKAFPRLYHNVVDKGYSDADSFVELLCAFGVVLSMIIASGIAHHGIIFLAVTSIYHFLVTLDSTFYSFQWDSLLVETGFLTGICFAPWRTRLLQSEQRTGSWPIRFLLFKLMFMSGVVKIQADCPTWQNLTALEYHFATQCLPGPLAWYAHQLPPLMLRLGVAATFIVEIPAAFLLLSPFVSMRKVGAWMQILLQILIIATGSYNYFNLLTMALCLPCMIGEESHLSEEKERSYVSRIFRALQLTLCALFMYWSCKEMLMIEYVPDSIDPTRKMISLKLAMTKHDCNLLVEQVTPIAVACMLVSTAVTGIHIIVTKKSNRLSAFTRTLVCCLCIAITAVPFIDLSPKLSQTKLMGLDLSYINWRKIRSQSWDVSHGYGLFRRMTGVGQQPLHTNTHSDEVPMGWAGLPPSIVARPEIILEAKIDGSDEWRELNFRWKPGQVNQRPLQAAPHQPRFDWRMWFAALGTIQHNPWFVSFIEKLLAGCPTVLDILDEPEILAGQQKITSVRANLYHYDFTRLDTKWARRIPGIKIVDTDILFQYPDQVWTRKMVRQYLPPLEANNQSLIEFLQHAGYGPSVCVDNDDRCSGVGTTAVWTCRMATTLRKWSRKSWGLPLAAFLFCLTFERLDLLRQRKHFGQEKLKSD